MMSDKKSEDLNEYDLDQVTGGAGGKGLVAHELTHVRQQGGSTKTHDHLTDHNWQLEIEGVTTGKQASGDITMKGKKINQN